MFKEHIWAHVSDEHYDFRAESFDFTKEDIFRVWSQDNPKLRYYYGIFDGIPMLLNGITTAIDDGFPDSQGAKAKAEWAQKQVNKGLDPNEELSFLASYGTWMHILYGELLKGNTIPFAVAELSQLVLEYDSKIPDRHRYRIAGTMMKRTQKDLMAFRKWVKDFNVKPLAIELLAALPEYRIGSAIDLICEIDAKVKVAKPTEYYVKGEKKGQPKPTTYEEQVIRVIAIVDFKTSLSGFYDSHVLQLLAYKKMAKRLSIPVTHVFNYAAKDWRKEPDYSFVQQDSKKVAMFFDNVFNTARSKFLNKTKSHSFGIGSMSLWGKDTAEYRVLDLQDALYREYNVGPSVDETYRVKFKELQDTPYMSRLLKISRTPYDILVEIIEKIMIYQVTDETQTELQELIMDYIERDKHGDRDSNSAEDTTGTEEMG